MNLKKEYREFISSTCIKIKDINIEDDIDKKKCISIYKLYLDINNQIENSDELNVNDINHIILNYNRDNNDIELLKKFIKIKNVYIIKRIIQSKLWEDFVLRTISKLNFDIDMTNKNNMYILEKGIYHLLIKSSDLFRGCWEIANFKDDKILKLEIVEPDDIEFLVNYITKKLK